MADKELTYVLKMKNELSRHVKQVQDDLDRMAKAGITDAKKLDEGFEDVGDSAEKAGGKTRKFGENIRALDATIDVVRNLKAAFDSAARGIEDLVRLYADGERSEIAFATAIRNNPYISGEGYDNLQAYIAELRNITIFDDDQLRNNAMALAQMNLTEEQIIDVLDAATNLASSGIMPLDQAVDNLGRTFSGSLGFLGRTVPQTKNLTEVQLKHGDAVKIVADQYRGMNEAIGQTSYGKLSQIKNDLDDIKKKFGLVLSPFVDGLNQVIDQNLPELMAWFDENSPKIMAVLATIPSVLADAFSILKTTIKTTFDKGNWTNLFSSLAQTMAILFKAGFQEFTDFAKEKLKELSIQKMSADLFSGILEKDIFGRARKKYERDNDRGWAVDQYIPDTVFSKLPDFKYLSDKDQQAFYEILNDESMRTAGNSILNNDLSASGKRSDSNLIQEMDRRVPGWLQRAEENKSAQSSDESSRWKDAFSEIGRVFEDSGFKDTIDQVKTAVVDAQKTYEQYLKAYSIRSSGATARSIASVGDTASPENESLIEETRESFWDQIQAIDEKANEEKVAFEEEVKDAWLTELEAGLEEENQAKLAAMDQQIAYWKQYAKQVEFWQNYINKIRAEKENPNDYMADDAMSSFSAGDVLSHQARYIGSELTSGTEASMLSDASVLDAATAGLASLFLQLENVTALLNPLSTIVQAAFEFLKPVINDTLAPLVGILRVVGQLIGGLLAPAIKILTPIIEGVAALFIWLYNSIVRPIYNGLMWIFNKIYNAFASFINGILWMIDQIPFVKLSYRVAERDAREDFLDELSMSDLYSAGNASTDSSGASYTQGRVINITVNFNDMVIATGGETGIRELAVMLRDEMYQLEALGA